MRTLLLLRHAKSASDDTTLADFERPLSPEGERITPIIGRFLRDTIGPPDLVLCSEALRARRTWEHMAGCFEKSIATQISHDLYLAPAEGLLDAIRQAPAQVQRLLVVAHNPGIRQLAARLASTGDADLLAAMREKFPTAAMVEISLDIADWREVTPATGKLHRFVTPKQLAAE